MWVREHRSTCLSLRRSACLLVHSLSPHCKNSLLQNTNIQPQNFFFNLQREMPTSCTRQMQFLLQNIETLWEFWYSCFASHPLNVHCISMRFLYTHNHPKKLWSLSICPEVQILSFIESSLYIYKTVILNIEHFYKKIIWSYFIEQFSFAYQEHTW